MFDVARSNSGGEITREGPALPIVSVIMPVHNGNATIDRAISSLLRQSFPTWELVAVDDGSTDGSGEHLLDWKQKDDRIRVLRTEANRGPGAARNEAIRHAAGPIVVYLDCDDEFYPDYLEHVARLRNRSDILIFGYDYLAEGEDLSRARTWSPVPHKVLFFEKNLSTPLGVAHRRELWEQVGGFDESLWCQEDWEFWKRLARTGAEVLFIPLRSGIYRFRPGSRSQAPRVTPGQRAAYEAARAAGAPLYGAPARPVRRPAVQKVLFAAPYSYLDPALPAAAIARDMLDLLARSGFTCQAFCGAGSAGIGDGDLERTLEELGLSHQARDSTCGPYLARLTFTRKGDVPVTLVRPRPTRPGAPHAEAATSFLAFFEKFLETYRPDALLTHSENPSLDPLIRLAKRRDIPVVVPLLDAPYCDRMAFYNVDYCLVTSEESRRRYWEELGLNCIALPPPTDPAGAGPAYAAFFRDVHPQPGPPLIPVSDLKT